jgi:hypothetical protein
MSEPLLLTYASKVQAEVLAMAEPGTSRLAVAEEVLVKVKATLAAGESRPAPVEQGPAAADAGRSPGVVDDDDHGTVRGGGEPQAAAGPVAEWDLLWRHPRTTASRGNAPNRHGPACPGHLSRDVLAYVARTSRAMTWTVAPTDSIVFGRRLCLTPRIIKRLPTGACGILNGHVERVRYVAQIHRYCLLKRKRRRHATRWRPETPALGEYARQTLTKP